MYNHKALIRVHILCQHSPSVGNALASSKFYVLLLLVAQIELSRKDRFNQPTWKSNLLADNISLDCDIQWELTDFDYTS